VCAKELKVFEECFVVRPLKEWLCDSEGLPVVQQQSCSLERNLVEECLQKGPSAPPAAPAH
jgi:hypothetical protein